MRNTCLESSAWMARSLSLMAAEKRSQKRLIWSTCSGLSRRMMPERLPDDNSYTGNHSNNTFKQTVLWPGSLSTYHCYPSTFMQSSKTLLPLILWRASMMSAKSFCISTLWCTTVNLSYFSALSVTFSKKQTIWHCFQWTWAFGLVSVSPIWLAVNATIYKSSVTAEITNHK